MTPPPELTAALRRTSVWGLVVAIVGGAVCVDVKVTAPERFYAAYLTAFVYWLGIAMGCLVIALIHGMTGGAWGRMIRRVLESGYETLPLMALLFIPIWLGVAAVYDWTDLDFVHRHESVARKAGYLNIAGFQSRAVAYFAIWMAMVPMLNLSSPNAEQSLDSPRSRRLQLTSGLCLVIYGFSFTLAAVDWMMSLEPEWYSTMYGLIQFAGHGVSGLSFAVIATALLSRFESCSQIISPTRLNDLGNLMLASVMFWTYCSFFQFLVVWCGNLPEENVWYVHRSRNGWQYVALCLITLHFAVPFLLLLSRRVKRQTAGLWRIAALLLTMRYVDLYWLIIPGFQRETFENQGPTFHLTNLAALAAIGGAWLSLFAWRLSVRIRLPMFDPEITEAIDERSSQPVVA